ncbi:hypothetical protein GQ44DRAFT_779042 [Phaeosphaeriaceae sp. PMI808]|nr:hypothetical protein GQ44DRAFT_779042 [Phaeosphaeriaceae sp. PMI808]
MASSCSTSLLNPSLPMKIIACIPRAPKPRLKSKAKPISITKAAEHTHSGIGSSRDDRDWLPIDDFPMSNSHALRSFHPGASALFEAANASSVDAVNSLSAASELEKPDIAKTNSALNQLFDRSYLELSLTLESDAVEEHPSTTQVRPNNEASDY